MSANPRAGEVEALETDALPGRQLMRDGRWSHPASQMETR